MDKNYFCSNSSIQSKDNRVGTASNYKHLLLIEYRGIFKNKAFDESEIPQNFKTLIQNFIKVKPNSKLLLIKKDGTPSTKKLSLYGASNFNYNHIEIDTYQDISIDLLNGLFVNNNETQAKRKPLFLVCTNGTKDKCCAKFGLPIWKKFNDINNNAWQCTHLGGDRYAPTALVLPSFSTYGHIANDDVPLIIANEENEKIYLNKIRGVALYNFYEQAADIHVRKVQNIENAKTIQIISSEKIADNIFNVHIKNKQSNKEVQLRVEKKPNKHFDYMTCKATKKSYSFEFVVSLI